MRTRQLASAVAVSAVAAAITAAPAVASTYVSGGSRSCSGSTMFVGIQSRANGTVDVYTNGIKRITYFHGVTVKSEWYESNAHSISSWKVQTTDSINATETYSYCYQA